MLLMGGGAGGCEAGYRSRGRPPLSQMGPQFDEDAPGGDLLKPAIPANAQNNTHNFFHWNQRSSMEGKANFMDTLPAILVRCPKI